MVLDKCIEIHKKNNRFRFVNKEVLKEFLQSEFHEKINSKARKNEIEEIAYSYLSPKTVELFTSKLKNFGITRADIAEVYGISKYKATKLTENGSIAQVGEFWSSTSGLDLPYYIYSIPDVVALKVEVPKTQKCVEIEESDQNIAEALYLVNQSAKVSRDTKCRMYTEHRHTTCQAAKTRSNNLYGLKKSTINKLIKENRITKLGYNKSNSGMDYLALYTICDFSFHIPYCGAVPKDEIIGQLEEKTSAEKTRKTSLNFREAVTLLEKYCGVKTSDFKYWY